MARGRKTKNTKSLLEQAREAYEKFLKAREQRTEALVPFASEVTQVPKKVEQKLVEKGYIYPQYARGKQFTPETKKVYEKEYKPEPYAEARALKKLTGPASIVLDPLSPAFGGGIKEVRETGNLLTFPTGAIKGLKEEYGGLGKGPMFGEELAKSLGVKGAPGIALMLGAEVLLPGTGEAKLLGKGEDVKNVLKAAKKVEAVEESKKILSSKKTSKLIKEAEGFIQETLQKSGIEAPISKNTRTKLETLLPNASRKNIDDVVSGSKSLEQIIPQKPTIGRGGLQPPELDFSSFKDKEKILLNRETFDRNIVDVAGKQAPAIKKFVSDPLRANEVSRVEITNNLRNEIRETIVKKYGIRAGSKEDALIQRFGEGRVSIEELKKLTPKWQEVKKSAELFRVKYDDLLDQWNKVRANFGYTPVPKRQDYFRHFQEAGTISRMYGNIGRAQDLPTEISGITQFFKPGKPFATAELERVGGQFTESAIRGFDNYLDDVTKQIYHTDSVQRIRQLESYIREAGEVGKAKLPNFVSNIREFGNSVAGKTATFDRSVEDLFGRKGLDVVSFFRRRTSANLVAGNVSSALTNFIPFTQTLATTSKPQALRGIAETLVSPFLKNFNDIGGVKSSFLTRRFKDDVIDPTKLQKAENAVGWLFETIDRFTTRSAVTGKFYENLSKGMDAKDAMKGADEYVAKVFADRSIGQLPNFFNNKTLGIFTQFQTEVNNMASFIGKDIPEIAGKNKAKVVSMLAQFSLYSYIFNNTFENITGRRPTIDPIRYVQTLLGVSPEGEGKEFPKRASLAISDLAENLPFTGGITGGRYPILSGLPDVAALMKGEAKLGPELEKTAFTLLPPFGGGQVRKTITGLKSYSKGASETPSGAVRFPIKQDIKSALQTGLFGQYSTPEARRYFQLETPPLGKNQTETFKNLPPDEAQEYYRNVINKRLIERGQAERIEGDPTGAVDISRTKTGKVGKDAQEILAEIKSKGLVSSTYVSKVISDEIENYRTSKDRYGVGSVQFLLDSKDLGLITQEEFNSIIKRIESDMTDDARERAGL